MFVIAKLNKDKEVDGFLYKTYNGRYLFKDTTNMFYTESEASNFIYYQSYRVKRILSEGDTLIALPYNEKDNLLEFKVGDKID